MSKRSPAFYRYSYLTSDDDPVYFAPVKILSDDVSTRDGYLLRWSSSPSQKAPAQGFGAIDVFGADFAAPRRWAYVNPVPAALDKRLRALGEEEDAVVARVRKGRRG